MTAYVGTDADEVAAIPDVVQESADKDATGIGRDTDQSQ